MRHPNELIHEKFKKVPEKIQDILSGPDTTRQIQEIAKKHGLHIDQMALLSDEIMFLMLGIEPGSEFINNIRKYVRTDKATAQELASEINRVLLSPVRNLLQSQQMGRPHADDNDDVAMEEPEEIKLESTQLGALQSAIPASALSGAEQEKESSKDTPDEEGKEGSEQPTHIPGTPPSDPEEEEETPLHERVQLPKQQSNLYKGVDPYREPVE